MRSFGLVRSLLSLALCKTALSWDPTDSIMDADSAGTGYLSNHNMDPSVITGGAFGQIWSFTVPTSAVGQQEQFYAKPLVYTPSSVGRQTVIVFSEQNRIYVLDAVNGTMYNMRDMGQDSPSEAPFYVSDLGNCNDISGTIGITGTPVIDNTTDTIYFWAKSYQTPGQRGYQNGAYRFHAIDAWTLQERPGFPTSVEGRYADNDNTRYFTGGGVLQRTSLNLINGVVYAGFGGHCDMFNYTGWVVGMKASTGKFVTAYSTSAGTRAYPQDGTWTGGGGGCGIWQAGAVLSSDNSGRLFFATGNGYRTTVNGQTAASGRTHLDTLSECIVNMAIDPTTGVVTQQDYFEPYTYQAIDSADRDLGSSGVAILPFGGGGINRLAVTAGKNGQCYVTNADNLGGYKMATGGGDSIIQTITPPTGTAMFGNIGAYPLEGGYMYLTPVGAPTYAYALGYDGSGKPAFSLSGSTSDNSAGRVGTGSPTITSMNGQAGTAILWMSDPDNGIRAYYAVPNNGKLTKITLPATPVLPKFQRPVFGNGRYYTTTYTGQILGFGSPVQLPLDCAGPFNFGEVQVGQSSTLYINCTTKIVINRIANITIGNTLYNVSTSSIPTGVMKAGTTFSFPVTFNLTGYTLDSGSTSAPSIQPGVQSGSITIITQNGATGYSTQQPLSVSGTTITASPFAAINPVNVNFSPLVIGSASAAGGSDNTMVLQNLGKSTMTILGYGYTINDPSSGAARFVNITKGSSGHYQLDSNGYFTTDDLPALNSTIAGGSSVIIHMNFLSKSLGDYYSTFTVWTNGGMAHSILTGSANAQPIALLEISTNEGGWNTISNCVDPTIDCASQISFGTSTGLTQQRLTIRITNNGGSDLIIDKSKPPVGTVLGAENPNTDLYEGMTIAAGKSSTAAIFFSPGSAVLNSDAVVYSGAWSLNVNDLTWGVHVLNFTGTLKGAQTGPTQADGTPRFKYLGCYKDSTTARLETTSQNNANNTNGACQSFAVTNKAAFAATEYKTECWVGRNIPADSLKVDDYLCQNYVCPGDATQMCGGVGSYATVWYDINAYFPSNKSLAKAYQPPSYKQTVGKYVYSGCRTDSTSARTLKDKIVGATSGNTIETCAASCTGYTYFGVEYGVECYCGNTLGGSVAVESTCSYTCGGDPSELCGGSSRISVYALNGTVVNNTVSTSTSKTGTAATAGSTPTSPATVGLFSYSGCYSDTVAARSLVDANTQTVDMSIEQCAAYCSSYKYFGLEYANQCYCGNAISNGGALVTDGRCNMLCAGNSLEYCGGSDGLTFYTRGNGTVASSSSRIVTTTGTASNSASSSVSISGVVSSTSSSAAPTATALLTCPTANYTSYTSYNGKTFLMECYIDHAAGDLGSPIYLNSWAACAESCSTTTSCVAFSWSPGIASPCYLKKSVGAANTNTGVWGAKMLVASTSSSSSSAVTSSSSVIVTSISASSASTTKSSSLSTTLAATAATASSSSTSSSAAPTATALLTCPTANYTSYTSYNGKTFLMECYIDHAAGDLGSPIYLNSWAACAESCSTTTSCVAFSWSPGIASPCYLKKSVGAANTNTGVWGAKMLVASTSSSSSSAVTSSSSVVVTSTSSSLSTTSAATASSSSASSSSTVASSSGTVTPTSSATSSSTSASVTGSTSSSAATSSSSSSVVSTSSSVSSSSSQSSTSSAASSTVSTVSTSSSVVSTSSTVSSSASTSSSLSLTDLVGNQLGSSTSTSASSSSASTSTSVLATTSSSSTVSSTSSSTTASSSVPSTSASASTSSVVSSSSTTAPTTTSVAADPTTSSSSSQAATSTSTSSSSSSSQAATSTSTSTSSQAATSTSTSTSQDVPTTSSSTSTSATSTSSSTSVVVTTTTSSVVSSTSSSASATATLPPWSYAGCANDNTAARALNGTSYTNSSMTVEMCQTYCTSKNYPLAGIEYSTQCYCGLDLAPGYSYGQTGCTMTCGGDSGQLCGGKSRLNVYKNNTYAMPVVAQKSGVSSFQGCYVDSTSARLLSKYTWTSSTLMSVDACVSTCSGKGYPVAGVEYGGECYCGNDIPPASSLASNPYDCQAMFCTNNPQQFCGGKSRMLLYA